MQDYKTEGNTWEEDSIEWIFRQKLNELMAFKKNKTKQKIMYSYWLLNTGNKRQVTNIATHFNQWFETNKKKPGKR